MNKEELQELYERAKDNYVTLNYYESERTITLENLIRMIREVDIEESK